MSINVYPDDSPNPVSDTPAPTRRNFGTIQVQMGGYEQLVRGEPMRAKFRDSWEKPAPLVPGKMVSVNSEMPDVNHTFRVGHRIMLQVQSSWFPLVDRNPQTFVDIPFAKPKQFAKAVETVYRSANAASGVKVLVLPTNEVALGWLRSIVLSGVGENRSRQTGIGATRHLFLCGAVQGLVAAAAIVVAAWRAPDRVQSLMCKTRALTPNGGELPNLRPATEARARGEI